jgi:predicted  nucleic acid-binding Zn-ribbon protein
MVVSQINHRREAQTEIMKTIDERLVDSIRSPSPGSFDINLALLEQRNRIAKIFGFESKGLSYYKTYEPGIVPTRI